MLFRSLISHVRPLSSEEFSDLPTVPSHQVREPGFLTVVQILWLQLGLGPTVIPACGVCVCVCVCVCACGLCVPVCPSICVDGPEWVWVCLCVSTVCA